MNDSYSAEEIRTMAFAAFAQRPVKCPRCGSDLAPRQRGELGSSLDTIRLRCGDCDLDGVYGDQDRPADKLEWTLLDKEKIFRDYQSVSQARCPYDEAVLKTIKSKTIGSKRVIFRCPSCGNVAQSAENSRES